MSVMSPIEVTQRDQFAEVVDRIARSPYAYKLPLYRAAQAGLICLCEVPRGVDVPLKRIDRAGRPAIILLGDDDYASTGPIGWPSTRKLVYWARSAFVHGTGGTADDYANAVMMAQRWRRLLLIETDSQHLMDWARVIQNAPRRIDAVFKRPTADGVHPLLEKEARH